MEYGELTLSPVFTGRNPLNGRFLKGHTPDNKGKKWSEYMSKRSQKRSAKGWRNVIIHRPKVRSDVAGRCRKRVIAVLDDGKWLVFPYIGAAAAWVEGRRENVCRCCKLNTSGAGNTDHKYYGVRFYYESSNVWLSKIYKNKL